MAERMARVSRASPRMLPPSEEERVEVSEVSKAPPSASVRSPVLHLPEGCQRTEQLTSPETATPRRRGSVNRASDSPNSASVPP